MFHLLGPSLIGQSFVDHLDAPGQIPTVSPSQLLCGLSGTQELERFAGKTRQTSKHGVA